MRYLGGVIIWGSFAITFAILFGFGFYTYFYARHQYDPDSPTQNYLAYTAYVLWALSGILVLALLFFCNAIKLGIEVFNTTALYIQSNMEIFVLPLASTIASAIWFLFWLFSAVYIFSVGTPTARTDFPFMTNIVWSRNTRAILLYHVFALLWVNSFIIASVQYIIAASSCIWYFEVATDTKGRFTLKRAAYWFFRYNWGSVAVGSLIVAIC
jgi:Plasma-membrane choline transporter